MNKFGVGSVHDVPYTFIYPIEAMTHDSTNEFHEAAVLCNNVLKSLTLFEIQQYVL